MTIEQELEAAYAELRKQYPAIRAVFDRDVWERAMKGIHTWKCIDPGVYDTTYKCSKCGQTYVGSADNVGASVRIHNSKCPK